MEIHGFIRKNSFLRFIDLDIGWENGGKFNELIGHLLVSDIRNDDDGTLQGIGLVRVSDSYAFVDTTNLTVEQATNLRDALNLMLDDNTKAADDGAV